MQKDTVTKFHLTLDWSVRLKTRSVHWGRKLVTGRGAGTGERIRINRDAILFSEEES